MNTASSLDGYSSVWWSQTLHVYWPWSWCGFQTDLTAACWRCRKRSAQKQNFSRLKAMLKSCAAACEDSRASLARRSLEYLIKERVVPPLDPGPVGLSTHMDLHHGFDVVSRQLTGLDDPNTNLRKKKEKKKDQLSQNQRENKYTQIDWSLQRSYKHKCAITMKVEEELPGSHAKKSDCFEKLK